MSSLIKKINDRRLIQGPEDKLMCISPLKHKWAMDIFKTMRKNDWYGESIAMGRDKQDYETKLDDGERLLYDRSLAFISNLDGIQFDNLITNIGQHVTSPEVSMALSRQAYEEANHVAAYAIMIEAISANPLQIYGMYESNEVLAAKNEFIMRQSDALKGEFTPEKFALAIVGNVCLEGIYFFNAFENFFLLAKQGKMLGSADQIRYIQRDELTHLSLFVHMYACMQVENPGVFTPEFYRKAAAIVRAAVDLEVAWGCHTIEGGVLGKTPQIVKDRVPFLANQRVAMLGWAPLYPGVKNPTPWVDAFSQVGGTETNFFEGKPTDYKTGGSLDWD